jgi:hypothetical protein
MYQSEFSCLRSFLMLSKCANPACSTPLIYLREGKIFMIESSRPNVEETDPVGPKAQSRVEHFWLCGPCSSVLTLAFDREHGVQVVRKGPHSFRAAG